MAACRKLGEFTSIVFGTAMNEPGRPKANAKSSGLDGCELVGSGKPVTPWGARNDAITTLPRRYDTPDDLPAQSPDSYLNEMPRRTR